MSIRASASARNITPDEEVPLHGFPGTPRLSTGTRDDLYVSAVHVRSGSTGIILMSFDLLHLDPSFVKRVRRMVEKATGNRIEHIFLGTTQNHAAPVTNRALYWANDPSFSNPNPEYLDFVAEQAVQASSEAAVASRLASVATISLDQPGTGAWVIKDNTSSRVMSVVIVYPDIGDHLGAENTQISSDFVHHLRKNLAARFGGNPAFIYFAAPVGNRKLQVDPPVRGEEAASDAGKQLADLILTKIKALTGSDFKSEIDLGGHFIEVSDLPRRALPNDMQGQALLGAANDLQPVIDQQEADLAERQAAKWANIEASNTMGFIHAQEEGSLASLLAEYEPVQLQYIKLDRTRLLGLPGAILPDCSREILSRVDQDLWIAECVNGDLMNSVLAHSEEHDSFSLMSSVFHADAGNMLVNSVLSYIQGNA